MDMSSRCPDEISMIKTRQVSTKSAFVPFEMHRGSTPEFAAFICSTIDGWEIGWATAAELLKEKNRFEQIWEVKFKTEGKNAAIVPDSQINGHNV